jgi:predicted GIY-YIG superfamily endonuclease
VSFWVYLLLCSDGSYYCGHSDNLDRRLAQHDAGEGSAYTRSRRPVTLVYAEEVPTRLEALEAEQRIKGWNRAKKRALVERDWAKISRLAHRGRPQR